ncbi:MAG TPA: S8 family serine peptidase, partial [Fibrobacteria bacterium]|nr:S8 family serine peptidase [Fibrobacteria bacterium]
MRAPAVLSALAFAIPCLLAARPASGNSDPGSSIKVWVHLADKGPVGPAGSAGNRPRPFSRAWEDAPIHAPYLETLSAAGLAVDTRLKWQNLVSGRIDPARLPRLRALPFVTSVSPLPRRTSRPRGLERVPWLPSFLEKRAAPFVSSRGSIMALEDLGALQPLADTLGITPVLSWLETTGRKPGQGIRVAVMDADFDLGHKAFDRLRQEGRIKDEWDFVDGDAQAVSDGFSDSHGAQCLSLIGGHLPGILVGAAPEADFLLYRTENADVEAYVEEDYLAAAIERAVDSGAQVISISVVYRTDFDSQPDIPLAEVDGRTRPS